MIAATSFLLDGDMALWVWRANEAFDGETGEDYIHSLDRPCDTCGGKGWTGDKASCDPCKYCDGAGRHAFDIEVENQHWLPHGVTFTVHVIDVLSIHGWDYNGYDGRYVEQWLDNSHHIVTFDAVRQEHSRETINLPPDAAPGKHLVRLAVHQ